MCQLPCLTPLLWQSLQKILNRPELILRCAAHGVPDPLRQTVEEREQNRMDIRFRMLEKEEERLLDAYQSGQIEMDRLKERKERIAHQKTHLRTRLAELDARRQEERKQLHLIDGVKGLCEEVVKALQNPSFEQKVNILRLLVDRVIVKGRRITIRHIIPIGDLSLSHDSAPNDEKQKWAVGRDVSLLTGSYVKDKMLHIWREIVRMG